MTHSDRVKDQQSELKKFKAAFDALVPRKPALLHKAPIYLAIQAKLRRSQLSDISPLDILYEAWLLGVQSIERGKPIKKPDGWIYTVALRSIAGKIPKKGRRKQYFVEYDSVTDERVMSGDSPEKTYEAYDDDCNPEYQKVRLAMQQLSDREQEILETTLLDAWSYAEIAERQVQDGSPSVEPAALRKQKSRAMKKLKELYHRLG